MPTSIMFLQFSSLRLVDLFEKFADSLGNKRNVYKSESLNHSLKPCVQKILLKFIQKLNVIVFEIVQTICFKALIHL